MFVPHRLYVLASADRVEVTRLCPSPLPHAHVGHRRSELARDLSASWPQDCPDSWSVAMSRSTPLRGGREQARSYDAIGGLTALEARATRILRGVPQIRCADHQSTRSTLRSKSAARLGAAGGRTLFPGLIDTCPVLRVLRAFAAATGPIGQRNTLRYCAWA
jgi:hypothetical protein